MTNGEKIEVLLKPRPDQIRIYSNFVEIEIQSLAINFSCELDWWYAEYKEPTTKNCESCRYYGSHHEVCNYCYKCSLWTEKGLTTVGVDCISRDDAINAVSEALKHTFVEHEDIANKIIGKLPTITPQEPQTFKWCTDCKEYDQEKHCCHRWSKVIRNTVDEMKQEYIEREVLDKIRAEVENINVWGMRYNPDTDKDRKPQIVQKVKEHVIEILDKYKAESEET